MVLTWHPRPWPCCPWPGAQWPWSLLGTLRPCPGVLESLSINPGEARIIWFATLVIGNITCNLMFIKFCVTVPVVGMPKSSGAHMFGMPKSSGAHMWPWEGELVVEDRHMTKCFKTQVVWINWLWGGCREVGDTLVCGADDSSLLSISPVRLASPLVFLLGGGICYIRCATWWCFAWLP